MKRYWSIFVSLALYFLVLFIIISFKNGIKGGDGVAGLAHVAAAIVGIGLVVLSILIYAIIAIIASRRSNAKVFRLYKVGFISYFIFWIITVVVFFVIPTVKKSIDDKKRIKAMQIAIEKQKKETTLALLSTMPNINYQWIDSSKVGLVKTDNGMFFSVTTESWKSPIGISELVQDSMVIDSIFMANRVLFYTQLFCNDTTLSLIESSLIKNDIIYNEETCIYIVNMPHYLDIIGNIDKRSRPYRFFITLGTMHRR